MMMIQRPSADRLCNITTVAVSSIFSVRPSQQAATLSRRKQGMTRSFDNHQLLNGLVQ